jgi:hypothetical protein
LQATSKCLLFACSGVRAFGLGRGRSRLATREIRTYDGCLQPRPRLKGRHSADCSRFVKFAHRHLTLDWRLLSALIALKMTLNLPLFIAHNKLFIHTVQLLHEIEPNNDERLKFVFKLALLAKKLRISCYTHYIIESLFITKGEKYKNGKIFILFII